MLNTLKQLASNIPAALLGGGTFLFCTIVLPHVGIRLGFLLSLGISLLGYVIGGLMIFPPKQAQLTNKPQHILDNVIKEGRQKLTMIRQVSFKAIASHEIRKKIERICQIGDKIFELVEKKPHNLTSAYQFSLYYLDPTIKIIRKYIELSEHKAYSPDIQQMLKKVEGMLDNVDVAFEKQLTSLLKDDVLDLDTELSVLQEMIDIEDA